MFFCLIVLMLSFNHSSARNTLLILADDAGMEIGAYGNPVIRTPHIDNLSKKSSVFTNAFTSVSSCSPSRSAILTGLPNHQNGMYGLHQGVHHFNSFDKINSLPNILKKQKGILSGIVGKKHVGPKRCYKFDFEHTEEQESILQIGRNITHIKLLVRKFLNKAKKKNKDFFLYVGFHDPHRCERTHPQFGAFCQKFGDGSPGSGSIPDWKPEYYDPKDVYVPYFIPDTPASRQDIAHQYTTISRLDQGVGLVLQELARSGFDNDTLVIFTSDNGIPFPSGRTNLYDSGIHLPLLISTPNQRGHRVDSLVSLLDLFPTILDWHNVKNINEKYPQLTGRSITNLLADPNDVEPFSDEDNVSIFGSHTFHEVTMLYPMRYVRTNRFKLIHNLNYWAPFPIDQDFYISPSFQDILARTVANETLPWYKTLSEYYFRSEWELFDLKHDPQEMINLVEKQSYQDIFKKLQTELLNWQNVTKDPWICSPHEVLEDEGRFKDVPSCMPLYQNF